jgi:hypothetical protein
VYVETTMDTETRANFIDFYDIETGERLLAHELSRPYGSIWNIISGWQSLELIEQLGTATGITADRGSDGRMLLGVGEHVGGETIEVGPHTFERRGVLSLTGGKITGPLRVDYATREPERERTVRFVKRSTWA